MPILYSVVARGTTVLAKYASCAGNFTEVTEQILMKIPQENSKLTYSHGSYLFHYITEDKIVYMCITDDLNKMQERKKKKEGYKDVFVEKLKISPLNGPPRQDFERSKAFLFLNEIKRRFQAQYGVRAQTALPYAMNSDFSRTMASQMRSVSEDRPDQVSKVQTQVDELKCIMVKNIDHLAERGEKLELLVDKTEDLSANVIIYFIVSAACGGLDWPCTK
ncbi:vesicle-associated membrane protein 7-like isoform X2 [Biomphalaria glabrata]|uniref:AP-3 complex subunit delta-1 n=1 Tax=Biomphalaria glabrata TaxID=6526 RepID=A0A9W3B6B7_BIOGL|nr:vesicle-associated membrane protein 7-like isoform X2 [Biomphalaria glabrata]